MAKSNDSVNTIDYRNPAWYTNRELSWLDFNYRILDEARDKKNPLFERLKFLSITASNLDEFFMVRVASLKDMVHAKYSKPDLAGLRADQQLELVQKKCHELIERQYSTLIRSLANYMRTQYLIWNKDSVADETIFADIEKLSDYRLKVPEGLSLKGISQDTNFARPSLGVKPQSGNKANKYRFNKKKKK